MKLRAPAPRLLPATIVAMGVLLGVKSVALVRAAIPANAGETAPAVPPASAATASPAIPAPPRPAGAGQGDSKSGEAKTDAPVKQATATEAAMPPEPPISASERSLLLDLRKRSSELDAREAALAARESVLGAAEARISRRLDELGSLQKRLEALEAAREDRDEASWRGLVKLYESMKPREAAVIFNDLDMGVLVPVVDRMKETKAALVLAAMQPDRARQLTAELAQRRAHANAVPPVAPAAAASEPSAKGAGGG